MKLKCLPPALDLHGQNVDYTFTERVEQEDVYVYTFTMKSVAAICPQPITVRFVFAKDDVFCVFRPNACGICTLSPDWAMLENNSRSASGAPVLAFIGGKDNNRLTIALSDCKNPVRLRTGLHEEDCTVLCEAELFSDTVAPLNEYSVDIRLDFRDVRADECMKDVRTWWTSRGYASATLPTFAALPMYSTWYSMHQQISSAAILEQCRLAKPLGMDTVIIDDGWQTNDSNRGYAYCGDWKVCAEKIPDLRALVEELHDIGMKVMLWFSVPFVGKYAAAYKTFAGKYLYTDDSLGMGVLDPRFPEVRAYLADTYVRFARAFGIDGFKLDFIDSCRLTADTAASAGGDCTSLEDGIEKLLADVTATLKEINPEVMIEFRQTYTGGVMQEYGNMLRVSDCPGNAAVNKFGSIELRLLSNGIAVHADPIVWHLSECAEIAAMQINHTLFAVPQISVDLVKLPIDHKKMLTYYLSYMRENRETLLFGDMHVDGLAHGITVARATGKSKTIAVSFGGTVDMRAGNADVINATCAESVILTSKTSLKGKLCVVDCMGTPIYDRTVCLNAGSTEIEIPISGFAFFTDLA